MQLNASEISNLIKERIKGFELVTEARNEGTVVSVTDGIVRVHGLSDAMQGEMLEFPGKKILRGRGQSAFWLLFITMGMRNF